MERLGERRPKDGVGAREAGVFPGELLVCAFRRQHDFFDGAADGDAEACGGKDSDDTCDNVRLPVPGGPKIAKDWPLAAFSTAAFWLGSRPARKPSGSGSRCV